MAYASWSVVFGEQPSAAKWNILGSNDASFNDGSGFASGALGSSNASLAAGIVCQVVNTVSTAVNTGTTLIPNDDTIPQITEGDEYMTLAITPKSATNVLIIEVVAMMANSSAGGSQTGAIFQDAGANALAASAIRMPGANLPMTLITKHTMTAGTASATTFRYRSGNESAGTTTFNGRSGARLYGAITKSSITIMEYKA